MEQPQQAPLSSPQQSGPTDPAELETFLDAFFAEQMETLHIPGAVVVFVKDGEVFLAKEYGLADVENGTSVDPDHCRWDAVGSACNELILGHHGVEVSGRWGDYENSNRAFFRIDNNVTRLL